VYGTPLVAIVVIVLGLPVGREPDACRLGATAALGKRLLHGLLHQLLHVVGICRACSRLSGLLLGRSLLGRQLLAPGFFGLNHGVNLGQHLGEAAG
jgi:hypothetical protein